MYTNVKQHCNCQSQNNFSTLNITLSNQVALGGSFVTTEDQFHHPQVFRATTASCFRAKNRNRWKNHTHFRTSALQGIRKFMTDIFSIKHNHLPILIQLSF